VTRPSLAARRLLVEIGLQVWGCGCPRASGERSGAWRLAIRRYFFKTIRNSFDSFDTLDSLNCPRTSVEALLLENNSKTALTPLTDGLPRRGHVPCRLSLIGWSVVHEVRGLGGLGADCAPKGRHVPCPIKWARSFSRPYLQGGTPLGCPIRPIRALVVLLCLATPLRAGGWRPRGSGRAPRCSG
jgi:hypothetical protein